MIRTIIAEDDAMVASINKTYAEKNADIKVDQIFTSGTNAWEYLQKNKADLLILDVYMPGMTGLELLEKIRHAGMQTDVIMVTAANDSASLSKALSLGIMDYLIKPFTYERFEEALQKCISRKKLLTNEKLFRQNEIDALLSHSPARKTPELLEKGMQKQTLDMIIKVMQEHPHQDITSEELSELTHLSKVTVRRYMNYLINEGKVTSTVDYSTGGRPRMCYELAS